MVYGGAQTGLMGVTADGVLDGGGEVIGVIPTGLGDREIAHPGLSDLQMVSTMHERKARMGDLADGFVVLPGGLGTLEELMEVVTWNQLGIHAKPVGLLDAGGYWAPLEALIGHAADQGFVSYGSAQMLLRDPEPAALLDAMADWRPPADAPLGRRLVGILGPAHRRARAGRRSWSRTFGDELRVTRRRGRHARAGLAAVRRPSRVSPQPHSALTSAARVLGPLGPGAM